MFSRRRVEFVIVDNKMKSKRTTSVFDKSAKLSFINPAFPALIRFWDQQGQGSYRGDTG